ncbi:hypothetical protein QTP86_009959 [Hemibagrus guttatus]|nr:hypothetical protein QTP86_009959 [Hemibagrus guttatus]
MLQTIPPDLLPFITTVINGSLTSGHVPTVFKKARVIPILKKPALDPSDISNYRPVSLLSFLSKILEHVVCNQLSDYLMQNNLHDPNQSGFKAAHSTETALLAVTEKLHAARSAKLLSVLILLDLSAAFDTVNHKTLLSTLRSLGICGTAWEWFASYLDGHSYQVTWKGLTSAPRILSTGVPESSVLGPLLFSLYTHSLGKVISSHGFSYHCYADDTQLIFSFPPSDTTASARISACLVDISSWMTAHQLKLNPSKTELLFIPGDPSPAQDLVISLNNSMISPSATARNLGVTMDNQLSFSSHVTNVTRSCRFLLYNIRRIRPFLSTQTTQVLVQSLVISRLDYCNSLLAGLPLNAICPLQMIQNAAAQLVFNSPKFSHTTPLLRSLHWLPEEIKCLFLVCGDGPRNTGRSGCKVKANAQNPAELRLGFGKKISFKRRKTAQNRWKDFKTRTSKSSVLSFYSLRATLEKHRLEFNPVTPLTDADPDYIHNPSLSDKVHCLVSVVPATSISQMEEVIQKMRTVRKTTLRLD